MPGFAKVTSCPEDENIMELPVEDDDTLLLSTIHTLFPSASGLKYRNPESNMYRTLKCTDGHIYPPADAGWSNFVFYCTHPKTFGDIKRKVEGEESADAHIKNQCLESKRCTDIIVLGLPWKSDETTLQQHFGKYGELAMVQVKRHPITNQSKGFGFIRFVDINAQVACLNEKQFIDGRWCEVKIPDSKLFGDKQEVVKKVYVGGLSEDISVELLRTRFAEFGQVTDVFIPKPFRNFAFVTFLDPDVAQGLLNKQIPLGNYMLNVQAAAPKLPNNIRQQSNHNMRQNQMYYNMGGLNGQNNTDIAIKMLNNPAIISSILSMASGQPPNQQNPLGMFGPTPSDNNPYQHYSNHGGTNKY